MSELISGAGGGGDSQSARVPREAPNTLRSVSKGRILDLIAHGPIVGLVDGMKSVFLDDTPLQNADGSFNFEGLVVQTREGYPDQTHISGFPAVENTVEVSTEVKYDTPVVRSISNNEADAVLVTLQVQGLSKTDRSTGDMNGHTVPFTIEVKSADGPWRVMRSDTISGKTTSAYRKTYRVPLDGIGPFSVKVKRDNPESDTTAVVDALAWVTATEVIDARLSYPDSAMVALEVDASLFGSKLPARSYDVKLSIISVPSNYDPETRQYAGIWDGTFKQAWTDNPAWVFYDLATHPTIGANLKGVDKWALYQIGQYCDELVPDGYGSMEPRFTVNTLFGEREEAITVLSNLASVFRGMAYWGSDAVMPVADMPGDPVKLVTPANVVGGEFEYSGTSLRERHSVAVVMWNDPDDNYKAKPELVEDPESIDLFGWRETQVTAMGCTSRGQARRLGKWILYSERMETQSLVYAASVDHADLRPGDYIQVADPDRAGARMGGRILAATTTRVTLDAVPPQTTSDTWFLSVTMPTGSIERREVLQFEGTVAVTINPFSVAPAVGAVWVLTSLSVTLPVYRVVSNYEDPDQPIYKITAIEHDPRKYDIVERDLLLPELPTSYLPTGPVAPPMDITVVTYKYVAGGVEHQALNISWTASSDVRITEYIVDVQGPDDVSFRTIYTGAGLSVEELDVAAGQWMIRIRALTSTSRTSQWVAKTVQIAGLLLPVPPDSIDVSVGTFSVSLVPRGAYPGAVYEFWRSQAALTHEEIEANAVKLSVSTDLVDVGLRAATQYFYYVRGANAYGLSAWYPVQATTLADFDDIITALDEDIRKPGGLFDVMVNEAGQEAVRVATAEVEGVRAEVAGVTAEAELARAEAVEALGIANGLVPRMGDVEAGITRLEWANDLEAIRYSALMSLHEGNSARATVEEVTRATEDASLSAVITTVKSEFESNKAQVQESLTSLATADSALASRVDSLQVQVGADVQAAIQTEQIARATADSALASRVDSLEVQVDEDIQAKITQEQIARATADSALASRVDSLEVQVDEDIQAKITAEQTARANADSALASQITTVSASASSAKATADGKGKVLYQNTAPATADRLPQNLWIDTTGGANTPKRWDGSAWVAVTDKVALDAAAGVTANAAAITAEQAARANADSALASQITTVSASASSAKATADGKGKVLYQNTAPATADRLPQNLWIDTTGGANTPKRWDGSAWVAVTDKVALDAAAGVTANAAAITAEQTARADADSALANQITSLTSNTNNQFASVQQQFTAQTSYTDGAVARAVTTATVNGKKAVFGISVDGTVSEIGAVADRFYVYNPAGGTYTLAFAVVNGQTVIQDAMIRNASITTAKIADAAITMAKISGAIQSDNYVADQTGWRLTKSGQFEINGTVAGQGRVRITNQVVEVFDSNGTRRVRMGIW